MIELDHDALMVVLGQVQITDPVMGYPCTDFDLLRPLYFMLNDARSMQNESCLRWEWWEAQMKRMERAGLVIWRRLPGTGLSGGGQNWVWDLTTEGAKLVQRGLARE